MHTISTNVTKKELDAIRECANACDETMSNCIRKSLIRQTTFMDGDSELPEYRCNIIISDNVSGDEYARISQDFFNKIRKILKYKQHEELKKTKRQEVKTNPPEGLMTSLSLKI